MTKEVTIFSTDAISKMAEVMVKSSLFGIRDANQAMALMLIAQAEGKHPATVAQEYHIINGKPALKADAMLARYLHVGGTIEWLSLTNEKVEAKFTHPSSGTVTVSWDIAQATAAGLTNNPTWKKFPRAMLRSRVVSEGIRTSYPAIVMGIYTPEEVEDMPVDKKAKSKVKEEKIVEPVHLTQEEKDQVTINTLCLKLNNQPTLEALNKAWLWVKDQEKYSKTVKDAVYEEYENIRSAFAETIVIDSDDLDTANSPSSTDEVPWG
ncbi:MAG: hypothetical protein ACKO37_05545 [Vampirovibrionales bacterium]